MGVPEARNASNVVERVQFLHWVLSNFFFARVVNPCGFERAKITAAKIKFSKVDSLWPCFQACQAFDKISATDPPSAVELRPGVGETWEFVIFTLARWCGSYSPQR